jgi:hypothetical protein
VQVSPSDEHFTHQVALPHAMVGSSDPSWRERYWISIQDVENRDLVLTCGFGQYPNQDVQEAFVVVSHRGLQHNLRLARALLPDRDTLRVGPFSVEIVRPFEELHLTLDDNESGLAFDLRWLSAFTPILEERHFQVERARATYDAMRYVQLGRVSGALRTPAGERAVHPDGWWGERDHSWGTRPLPRDPAAPPSRLPGWSFLMFLPIQFEDFCAHVYLFEDARGTPIHLSAALSTQSGEPPPRVVAVEHDLVWQPGQSTLTLEAGRIDLVLAGGRKLTFDISALAGRAYLRGGGYGGWNGWYQGHWKGEDSAEHDIWDLTDHSMLPRYNRHSSDHLIEITHEGRRGFGIVEYVVVAGHHRYGAALPTAPR